MAFFPAEGHRRREACQHGGVAVPRVSPACQLLPRMRAIRRHSETCMSSLPPCPPTFMPARP
eukprot:5453747-Alexandrium_andersonii.AAC.1